MRKVKNEEQLREEAGFYDNDLDSDDEETQKLLVDAVRIEEKEKLMRMEHTLNKVDRPPISRKVGKRARSRSVAGLEEQLGALGVDMKRRKMENLRRESAKPDKSGKKMSNLGRQRSLSAKRATPQDELLQDVEVRADWRLWPLTPIRALF